MLDGLQEALESLSDGLTDDLTEDDLEKRFVPTYVSLGYSLADRTIRGKMSTRSGIPDNLLLNEDESVQVVVELKRPSESLEPHVPQIQRYLEELQAPFGLLSNGHDFWIYEGRMQRYRFALDELRADPGLLQRLARRTVDFGSYPAVVARLDELSQRHVKMQGIDDLASTHFLDSLSLETGSAFVEVVLALQELLVASLKTSKTAQGCYEFWKQAFAEGAPKETDVPANWKPLLSGSDPVPRLMFCLETAYTVTARLILAKTLEDKTAGLDIRLVGEPYTLFFKTHLKQLASRGAKLQPQHWTEATGALFQAHEREAFASVYAQDIFDWWRDFASTPDGARASLGRALARLIVGLAGFDFGGLEGDILGELYQHYFDPQTRKALGEFYTPPEVVEFILDQVGYDGTGKLLDPATGSGTFLVAALRRYLKAHERRPAAEVLRNLTEGYELVGFDVNSFAVLMAQLNVAAQLVPLFARAIKDDPDLRLRRLPVIRTDSLRMEVIEEEHGTAGQTGLSFGSDEITAQIVLPVMTGKGKELLTVKVKFLGVESAKKRGLVRNEREWLVCMQSTFDAVKIAAAGAEPASGSRILSELEKLIDLRSSKRDALLGVLTEYGVKLGLVLHELRTKYNDGRFIKSLEDLMIGLIVKHYLHYDCVVGNPPYVRIQNLPEILRRYWETKYEWAKGNFDIFVPFIERALGTPGAGAWLTEGGKLGYIVPNRFKTNEYAETMRGSLPSQAKVLSVTDFGAVQFRPEQDNPATKLFREAMVYPAILICERRASTPEPYEFPVARFLPVEAPVTPRDALSAVRDGLAHPSRGPAPKTFVAGAREEVTAYLEVFLVSSAALKSDGWFLMPPDERSVFDKLRLVGAQKDPKNKQFTRILQHYTTTKSGGFAGIQTSLDSILVLDEAPGATSRDDSMVVVRPHGDHDAKPFPIERNALRPFLFGKDVGRWHIGWARSWVVFPYGWAKGALELVPSSDTPKEERANINFDDDKLRRGFDKVFPETWKYLLKHEKEIRSRDGGRYRNGKPDAFKWYGLARPQSLEPSSREKILVQLLARKASLVVDDEGEYYFQAGGKGGGAYGIALQKGCDLDSFAGILNSSALDFIVKEATTIFGGGYASYSDAQLRDLPIADLSSHDGKTVSRLAKGLSQQTSERLNLRDSVARFPASLIEELREADAVPDLETIQSMVNIDGNLAQNIDAARIGRIDEAGQSALVIGRARISGKPDVIELLGVILELRKRTKRDDLLGLEVPSRPADARKFIARLRQWQLRLGELDGTLAEKERELDDLVFGLYGLDASERATVRRFLRQETVEEKFHRLAGEWRRDARLLSSSSRMAQLASYRQIVGLGQDAVPLLLREMRDNPNHWTLALHEITQAKPWGSEDAGNLARLSVAWTTWGRERGLIE
jgi:hypothetical protein